MEKDMFLRCRNEIMEVLDKYGAEGWTRTRILGSALSEELNQRGYQMRLTVSDLPNVDEGNDRN